MALPSVRFNTTLTKSAASLSAHVFDGNGGDDEFVIDVSAAYANDLQTAFANVLADFELHEPYDTVDSASYAAAVLADVNLLIDNLSQRLPQSFHDFYWAQMHRKPFAPVFVDENDPFPWELVRPLPPPGRTLPAPTLGERFAMGRHSSAPNGDTPVPVSELLAICPELSPCPANATCGNNVWRNHASALAQWFHSSVQLNENSADRARVIAELTATTPRAVHFMGHSYLDPLNFEKSWLKLNGILSTDGLSADDVRALESGGANGDRADIWPWVFVNACDSAVTSGSRVRTQQGTEWTFSGWGKSFRQAGARATIGPYWNVELHAANRVARLFYEYVEGGRSLGEALRRIRSLFFTSSDLQHRQPTYLAYTLHGDPTIRAAFTEGDGG